MQRITRRQLIGGCFASIAGLAASGLARLGLNPASAADDFSMFFPFVTKGYQPPAPTPTPPPASNNRVVHIHASNATNWGFVTGWHGNYVQQSVVNQMVERGLRDLTNASSMTAAWQVLLPTYVPGQKIAIKVNLNNAMNGFVGCDDTDNLIDALIEVVNAVIRCLVTGGIRESDVMVYDASRKMPARFFGRREFFAARFVSAGCSDELATFGRADSSLRLAFRHPQLQSVQCRLADLLAETTYLINMPIVKRHKAHPVTLGFKNHVGSLDARSALHDFFNDPNLTPLVDIYENPNISDKTILTVGDCLFGAGYYAGSPERWRTFGGSAPNSLFFSRDPVAIDCVMADFLRSEWGLVDAGYDYLRLARDRGLGTFEKGEPWGAGYSVIDYIRTEMNA